MKTRRRFSTEFKAKLALEVIRGERTISELATKHQLHPRFRRELRTEARRNHGPVFQAARISNCSANEDAGL